jgi:pimeloyl-ACP methyl ester carboxylesterase
VVPWVYLLPMSLAPVLALSAVAALLASVSGMAWRQRRYLDHVGSDQHPPVRTGPAVVREATALAAAGWWQIWGRLRGRSRAAVGPRTGPMVLCVHGFMQNATGFVPLQRRLSRAGRDSLAVNLGLPTQDQRAYAAKLSDAIRSCAEHGPIDVVCHSMGGLVLRRALQDDPTLAALLHRVVTVATPHAGTAAARGLPLPETRAMGRRAAYLQALPTLGALVHPERVTSIAAADDTTVYPLETTRAGGSQHVVVGGVGHTGVLFWSAALDQIVAAVMQATPSSSGAARVDRLEDDAASP